MSRNIYYHDARYLNVVLEGYGKKSQNTKITMTRGNREGWKDRDEA